MTKPATDRTVSEDRVKADLLRRLKTKVTNLGKRGLIGTFAAGEALEEASKLLDGNFSVWVKAECGIEPRTALNYRKTFLVLGPQKKWLAKRNVSPSVAVTIACAGPKGRQRAMDALASGRSLSVAETKAIVRGIPSERRTTPSPMKSLERAMRTLSRAVVEEVGRMATLAADNLDENRLVELAVRARTLAPAAEALATRMAGGAEPKTESVMDAVAGLAKADGEAGLRTAALRFARAVATIPADRDPAIAAKATATPKPAVDAVGIRSTWSGFRHGLTAFEICTGAGGQAAGLAKAGFRHVGLVERDASACETLRAAFGAEHVVQADVVGYEPGDVGPVDLLAGGVPCQPFSQAGERRGASDERDLFPEALRLVERLNPRAVMLENVPGIFSPDNDMYRLRILSRLEELGYSSEWKKVDATHFGVPQKRIRAVLVAFKDPKAMNRFSWPKPLAWYADFPDTVGSALLNQFTSRGYQPSADLMDRMDRPSPTVTGGSDKKQGIDFGQRKTALVWGEMGFVQTRIGNDPPAADHEGPIAATNAMLATLQAFPFDWPFRGSKKSVFRQVANAFPTPVAMHLGCAIASALTGQQLDPSQQHVFDAMRWNHVARRGRSPDGVAPLQTTIERTYSPKRIEIPLASLRAASDLGFHAGSPGTTSVAGLPSAPPTAEPG